MISTVHASVREDCVSTSVENFTVYMICKHCCHHGHCAAHPKHDGCDLECRKTSKLDRNAATSARVPQPTAATKKRLPANGKHKNSRMDNFNSAAMDLFGTVSLDPYAFERSDD